MKQKAPFDIPEIKVKAGQIVAIVSAYTDASRDFRMEVLNPGISHTAWFMYDNKVEAQEEGWEV